MNNNANGTLGAKKHSLKILVGILVAAVLTGLVVFAMSGLRDSNNELEGNLERVFEVVETDDGRVVLDPLGQPVEGDVEERENICPEGLVYSERYQKCQEVVEETREPVPTRKEETREPVDSARDTDDPDSRDPERTGVSDREPEEDPNCTAADGCQDDPEDRPRPEEDCMTPSACPTDDRPRPQDDPEDCKIDADGNPIGECGEDGGREEGVNTSSAECPEGLVPSIVEGECIELPEDNHTQPQIPNALADSTTDSTNQINVDSDNSASLDLDPATPIDVDNTATLNIDNQSDPNCTAAQGCGNNQDEPEDCVNPSNCLPADVPTQNEPVPVNTSNTNTNQTDSSIFVKAECDFNVNPFSDLPGGHWGEQAMKRLVCSGILKGYGNGRVGPEDGMIREQLAILLERIFRNTKDNVMDDISKFRYEDLTSSDPHYSSIKWSIENRCMQGFKEDNGNYTFRKDNAVTRAEFVTALFKCLGVDYAQVSSPNPFLDLESDAWYNNPVRKAAELKWVLGYSDKTFKPNKAIERSEGAVLIDKMLQGVLTGEWKENVSRMPTEQLTLNYSKIEF